MKGTKALFILGVCSLLLATSRVVSGVDITSFSSTKACSGAGFSFNNIDAHSCAKFDASFKGSVLFLELTSCQKAKVYRGHSCNKKVGENPGPACFIGGNFGSGKYVDGCRRRNLLADSTKNSCVEAKPSGIAYTEDFTKGTWVLTTNNASELLSHLASIPEVEKTNWLRTHGAHLRSAIAMEGNQNVREIRI